MIFINMETIKIYTLSDSNGVKYVGKSININHRFNRHIFDAKNKKNLNRRDAWIKSLLNKGEKPKIEIIDEVSMDDWVFWEMYWIEQFLSWGFKLKNMTKGGEGTYGRIVSDETKKKMSDSKKGIIPKNLDMLLEINKENGKAVIQYTKDGKIVGEFRTTNEAKTMTGIENIKSVLKGKRNIAGSYIWRYKNKPLNDNDLKLINKKFKKKKKKSILQYDKNNNLIREWESVSEVKKKYSHINSVLSGRRKSAGGYIWKYKTK